MPLDLRDFAGQSADVEKNLGKALAQARVLSFALRNQQPENVDRILNELTHTLNAVTGLLMPIAIATGEAAIGEDA